jgi:hypothetical protein
MRERMSGQLGGTLHALGGWGGGRGERGGGIGGAGCWERWLATATSVAAGDAPKLLHALSLRPVGAARLPMLSARKQRGPLGIVPDV